MALYLHEIIQHVHEDNALITYFKNSSWYRCECPCPTWYPKGAIDR